MTDKTGAVVPNATVTLTEESTHVAKTAKSDGNGLYSFPNSAIGQYDIAVTSPGFQSYKQTKIALEVGSSIAVNVALAIGSTDQTVTVEAEGLALQTQDTSFKQTIDAQTITEMPLSSRQMTNLITLSGASAPAPGNDTTGSKNFATSVSISIAGGAGNETTYRLDGGDNMDYMTNVNLPFPFPDAVAQFSVETSALGAQQGQHPGGLVNVVTKSGTNSVHGSAFEFIRNNIINATNFFSTTKDTLHQNEYGGTLGGPILRNRLFLFGGFQHLRAAASSNATIDYIPTAANLAGDFSVTDGPTCIKSGPTQLVNPYTGAKLNGNQISPTTFDKSALALMKYFPATTDPCGQVNVSTPSLQTENQFITRGDWTISKKHALYGRYFFDDYQIPAYFNSTNILLTTTAGNDERAQSLTMGETWTINSRMVNLFHATGLRRRDNRGPAPGINPNTIGVNMYVYTPTMLRTQVTNKFNLYCGTCAPGYFNDNTFAFADDFNLVLGKHQLVLGGEYIRNQLNISNSNQADGNFTFSGAFSQYGPTGSAGAIAKGTTTADANLELLMGAMASFGQSIYSGNALRAPIPSLYAQDTWQVTRRFVMAGGLRWVPDWMPSDVFNRGSVFNQAAFTNNTLSTVYPTAPAGVFFYGDPGVSRAFTRNSLAQFSPNLGFTYDLSGTGKTVVRAGAALVYDQPNFFTAQRVNQNPPFATATNNTPTNGPLSFSNPYSTGTITTNPYPLPQRPTGAQATFPSSGNYIFIDPNFKPSYTEQWNASVQQQFAHGWELQVQYIGNHAVHRALGNQLDPALYIPGISTGPGSCAPLKTAPAAGTACSTSSNQAARYVLTLANPTQGPKISGGGANSTIITDGAMSNYHGAVATVQHRMSGSFSFLANYTYSKCLNIVDAQGDIAQTLLQDPSNPAGDYGRCGSDFRHLFNSTVVAMSHFPVKGWTSALLNHWEVAPLVQIRSGAPFTVTTGTDNSLTATGHDRPDLAPGVSLYTGQKLTSGTSGNRLFINKAAFVPNSIGAYGSVGRNTFTGPNYVNVDAEVSRLFPIYERLTLDLRLEAFNILNHPNFATPGTLAINSATFGQITSTASGSNPRIFQGAVKLFF